MKSAAYIKRGVPVVVLLVAAPHGPPEVAEAQVTGSAGDHVRLRVLPRLVRHVLRSDYGVTWALEGTLEAAMLRAQQALLA